MKLPNNYKEITVRKIYSIPEKKKKKKMFPFVPRENQLSALKALQKEIGELGIEVSISEMIRTAIDEHIANTKRKLHTDPNRSYYYGRNNQ